MNCRLITCLFVLSAGLLGVARRGAAQSADRIPERIASDSGAPNVEDFCAFVDDTYYAARSDTRAQSVNALLALLDRDDLPRPMRFKALIRLAQSYRMKAADARKASLADFRAEYHLWQARGEPGEAPVYDGAEPRTEDLKAVEVLRQIVQGYGNASKLATQKFDLAMLLARVGDENAELYFRDLVTSKDRRIKQLAKLGEAELLLARRDAGRATPLLADVAKTADAGVKSYALYRLGWVQALAGAGGRLKAIDAWTKLASTNGASTFVANAVRQDLVAIWAETGEQSRAYAFFIKLHDRLNAGNVMERIAYRDAKAGKAAEAAKTYQALTKSLPDRPGACVVETKTVKLYRTLAEPAELRSALIAQHDGCEHVQGDDAPAARRLLEATLLDAAKGTAAVAMRAHDPVMIATAMTALSLFLQAFPGHEFSYEARYEMAQLLELNGDRLRAAKAYLTVVKSEGHQATARDDASRRMLALARILVAEAAAQSSPTPLVKPVALPTNFALFVSVADAYVKYQANASDMPATALQAAAIKLEFGHESEAIKRLDAVARMSPLSQEGDQAVRTMLNYMAGRRDWAKLISWSETYLKRGNLPEPLTVFVLSQLQSGMWKRAEGFDVGGKAAAATGAYLAFQARFPEEKDADKALGRVVALDFAAGKGSDCLKTAAKLIDGYPNSALRSVALATSATIYAQLGDFDQAARSFQAFSQDYPSDSRATEMMLRGSEAFLAAENREAALQLLSTFASQHPNAPQVDAALLKVAKTHDESGDFETARSIYATLAQRPITAPEVVLFAKARTAIIDLGKSELGDRDHEAEARLAVVEKALKSLPADSVMEVRDAVAAYHFSVAIADLSHLPDPGRASLDANDFQTECAQLSAAVAVRDRQLGEIAAIGSTTYQAAVALAKGLLYNTAATVLGHDQPPPSVGQEEARRIGQVKERLLLDFRAKALANFKTAASASGLAAATWRQRAQKHLAELTPAHSASGGEMLVRPSFIDNQVNITRSAH